MRAAMTSAVTPVICEALSHERRRAAAQRDKSDAPLSPPSEAMAPAKPEPLEPAERSDGVREASGEWTRRSKAEARDAPLAEKPEDPLEQPERA